MDYGWSYSEDMVLEGELGHGLILTVVYFRLIERQWLGYSRNRFLVLQYLGSVADKRYDKLGLTFCGE